MISQLPDFPNCNFNTYPPKKPDLYSLKYLQIVL